MATATADGLWTAGDRLGAHAAARYLHFRRFVERQQSERLDHALFALLLSAESMRDEMRAYEEQHSALVRLAQTGHFVRQLQRLHGVLDAASASYSLKEAPAMKEWEPALADERLARAKRYARLLARLRGDDGAADQARAYAIIAADVETEARQEEALTLLAAAVSKHGHSALASVGADRREDVLTAQEMDVTQAAFHLVAQLSTAVVVALPEWFAAPFEFGGTFGLSRWGNDLFIPQHADPARVVAEASTWSRLNHPHVAKFLGACHVGDRMFLAHEKVRLLSDYADDVRDRAMVWRRLYEVALSLQYLHERGLACRQLDVTSAYCAKFEAKAVLLGIGLVELDSRMSVDGSERKRDPGPWSDADADLAFWKAQFIAADVQALGVLILNILYEATHAEWLASDGADEGVPRYQEIPKTRPGFLLEDEWHVIEQIRSAVADDVAGGMLHVLSCLGDFVGVDQRNWLGEAGFQNELQVVDVSVNLGALALPTVGTTVGDVLAQCESLSRADNLSKHVHNRLLDTFSQLRALDVKRSSESAIKRAVAHFSCVLARFYSFLQTKTRRDASMSMQLSCSFASFASSTLVASRKDPPQVFRLHIDVDRVLKEHGLDTSRAIHVWEPHWKQQCAQLESVTLSVLMSPPPAVTQHERRGSQGLPSVQDHNSTDILSVAELTQRFGRAAVSLSDESTPGSSTRLLLPSWFVPPTEVDVQPGVELGRGSFGSVHLGKWFDTPVVVKRVFVEPTQEIAVRAQVRHEADVWFQLNHINVVKLYGACHVGDPFFVCEYASGGNVDAYLSRKSRGTYLVWYSLLNAALGLQYLHDSGVVHGDLKANNILVGADDVVKLADFGLSTSTRGDQAGAHTGGALGAYRWKAPECLVGKPATFASDVYSFAMVMVELASGVLPWGPQLDNSVVKYRVVRGMLPARPRGIADDEWRLIQRMCCLDPTDRVTIDAVVIHLTSLLEKLDMRRLRSSNPEEVPTESFKNRVLSRGGALLSLLSIMKSSNKRLSALAAEHLLAVHMNRGARSEKREIEGIVAMLTRGSNAEKVWAADALESLSSENDGNRVLIAAAGGIEALLALVREGNNRLKAKAAAALRALAVNVDNRAVVAAADGIGPIVKMLRTGTQRQKAEAAGALRVLAANRDNKTLIASAGGIGPLVVLARDGSEQQKEEATGALMRLAGIKPNKELIASAGGISVLVARARDGSDSLKEKATGALRHLATDANFSASIVAAGGISALVALVRGDATDEQKENAGCALMLLAKTAANKAAVASAGAIEPLVALVREGTATQKEYAAGTLRFLALNDDSAAAIAAAGGIRPLVILMSSGTSGQKEQAVSALRNLALNADNRASIAADGGIAPLIRLVCRGTSSQKESAAAALRNLGVGSKQSAAIIAAGGIRPLVELLRDGTEGQREQALGALRSLSVDAKGKELIVSAEGIALLVAVAQRGRDSQRANAAATLRNLAMNADSKVAIAAAGGISPLVILARDGTDEQQAQAAGALRNLAANSDNKVQIAASGGVAVLVALARDGNCHQAESAVGALRSLALNRDIRASIIAAGGVDPLITLLRRGTSRQKEQAAGALWTVLLGASDATLLAAAGAVTPLMALVRNGTDRQKEDAVGALRCLAAETTNKALVAAAGGIKPLVALVQRGTDGQMDQAAGALQTLAFDDDCAGAISQVGGVEALVALACAGNDAQKERAASALRNLARFTDNKTKIAAAGGIEALVELVRSGTSRQKLEAAGALRNLAMLRANKATIAAVGGIRALVVLLRVGTDAQRSQVVGALEHLATSDKNAFMIAAAGGIKPMVELLRCGSSDQKEMAAGALGRLAANPRNIKAIAAAGAVNPLMALLQSGTDVQQGKATTALRRLGCTVCASTSQSLAADAWRVE